MIIIILSFSRHFLTFIMEHLWHLSIKRGKKIYESSDGFGGRPFPAQWCYISSICVTSLNFLLYCVYKTQNIAICFFNVPQIYFQKTREIFMLLYFHHQNQYFQLQWRVIKAALNARTVATSHSIVLGPFYIKSQNSLFKKKKKKRLCENISHFLHSNKQDRFTLI